VRVEARGRLERGRNTGWRGPVSRGYCRAETPGPRWDGTEVEWVGYKAVEEGVERRGRYTEDDQDCQSPNELS